MTIETLNTQSTSTFMGAGGSGQKNMDLAWKRQMEKDCFQLGDGRLALAANSESSAPVVADVKRSYATEGVVGLLENDIECAHHLQGAVIQNFSSEHMSPFVATDRQGGAAPLSGLAGMVSGQAKLLPLSFRTGAGPTQTAHAPQNDPYGAQSFNPANVLLTSSGADRCLYVRDFFTSTDALLNWIETELSRAERGSAPTRIFVNGKEYALHQGKLIREEYTHGN